MPKLKITEFPNDRPVKLAIELPAAVHRDLLVYAEILAGELGQCRLAELYLLKGTLDHRLFDGQASAPWIERRMSCHVESARMSRGCTKRIQTFHTAIVPAGRMAFSALIATPWLKMAVPNYPLRSPLGLAIVASTAIR
jgi:hypothetical protein